jgi:hypothetical protein
VLVAATPSAGVLRLRRLDEAEALLTFRGIPVPATRPARGRPRRGASPGPFQLPPGGVIPGAPPRDGKGGRKEKAWPRDACIAALREWDRELPASVDRSRAHYVRDSRDRNWPGAETLRRRGGFSALLQEALRLNRAERRVGSR